MVKLFLYALGWFAVGSATSLIAQDSRPQSYAAYLEGFAAQHRSLGGTTRMESRKEPSSVDKCYLGNSGMVIGHDCAHDR